MEECRFCGVPIEYANGWWWMVGSCGSQCSMQSGRAHQPHLPDTSSRVAVEEWLDAG